MEEELTGVEDAAKEVRAAPHSTWQERKLAESILVLVHYVRQAERRRK